jgi:glycosidase
MASEPTGVFDAVVNQALREMQDAAGKPKTRTVDLGNGTSKEIPFPFPSPADWREHDLYFLLLDRFNNPLKAPRGGAANWNRKFDLRQGGTFKGVEAQLDYLKELGMGALWLSPVLKNPKPDVQYNYHGYQIQDFLKVDERFASDGTRATAEKELKELVDAAHARGMYVIFDIVLNHAARVFDYERGGTTVDSFKDAGVLNGPLGSEPPIQFLNGFGFPRSDWRNGIPAGTALSDDDAVFPVDLQRADFFRRRGEKINDDADKSPGGFVRGDFGSMRQLVPEYDARPEGLRALRERYGTNPVLTILIRAHQYLISLYDIDGFRIDTVKYVAPEMIETFGNAIREYALSAGKRNFFTFGEIYDDEDTIARFVGRHNRAGEGFGIDAALDFPLFYKLPGIAKGSTPVQELRDAVARRKAEEETRISSHGEAGQYFVSFLDNHDQHERFHHPGTPQEQVMLGLALLYTLQGIPCLYYGTEQGLTGTTDGSGKPTLDSFESVREALWGKPKAFDRTHVLYKTIKTLAGLRASEPALRYGRIYFREVSGDGVNFGHSSGPGGIVAFSRVLAGREVLVVANTEPDAGRPSFSGHVVVDLDQGRSVKGMKVAFSNFNSTGTGTGTEKLKIAPGRFHAGGAVSDAREIASLPITLKPREVQVLITV